MQVAPGVHRFDTAPFNWYLIEEAGRLTLVDAGFPGHHRALLAGLAELGRTEADVEAIIITHAHADHMGFAERVRRASGAPLFAHAEDLPGLGHPLRLPWAGLLGNAWRPFTASMLARAVGAGIWRPRTIAEAQPVRDGDVLDAPGRPHVIHLPGHTPGQIALHLPDRGVLLSGDALLTRDLLTGAAGPPSVAPAALTHDLPAARRSAARARELGEVTLLPGHGEPWKGDLAAAVAAAC